MGKKSQEDVETETETSSNTETLGIMNGKKQKKKSVSQTTKAGLVMPVSRINRRLREGKRTARVGGGAPIYLAALLEYTAAEIFEMASSKLGKRKRLTATDILLGVRSDKELNKLLAGESVFVGDRVTGIAQAVTIKKPVDAA